MSYFNSSNKKIKIKDTYDNMDSQSELLKIKKKFDDFYELKNQTTNSLGIIIKHADVESAKVRKRR
tara:strand:- start:2353 stop:2550 length:198 start_codon:yes stop_codon:yes gene_type:complete